MCNSLSLVCSLYFVFFFLELHRSVSLTSFHYMQIIRSDMEVLCSSFGLDLSFI